MYFMHLPFLFDHFRALCRGSIQLSTYRAYESRNRKTVQPIPIPQILLVPLETFFYSRTFPSLASSGSMILEKADRGSVHSLLWHL